MSVDSWVWFVAVICNDLYQQVILFPLQLMFEQFQVPGFYVTPQPILTKYSFGCTIGTVLEVGDGVSNIAHIYEGHSLPAACARLDLAGSDVTDYFMKLLNHKGHQFTTSTERDIVCRMKENLAYVSLDYAAESTVPSVINHTLPDDRVIQVTEERFQCAELLFQPGLVGKNLPGLHQFLYDSIMCCDADCRNYLLENIRISGGCTKLPGFVERMEKELSLLKPDHHRLKLIAAPERAYQVWIGGSILGSLAMFESMIITKQAYEECGPCVMHRCMCL